MSIGRWSVVALVCAVVLGFVSLSVLAGERERTDAEHIERLKAAREREFEEQRRKVEAAVKRHEAEAPEQKRLAREREEWMEQFERRMRALMEAAEILQGEDMHDAARAARHRAEMLEVEMREHIHAREREEAEHRRAEEERGQAARMQRALEEIAEGHKRLGNQVRELNEVVRKLRAQVEQLREEVERLKSK